MKNSETRSNNHHTKAMCDAYDAGAMDRTQGKPKNPGGLKNKLRQAYINGWNRR